MNTLVTCKCELAYTAEQFKTLPLLDLYLLVDVGLPDFEFRRCVCGRELGVQLSPFAELPQHAS